MHHATSAYARTSQTVASPRDLEATVLLKAATRLQGIQEDWEARRTDLFEALGFNRKLWTILVTSVTDAENPIDADVRQNIVELGMFTFDRTVSCLVEPAPEKLTALVNINRELAAGLRAPAQAPQAA